MTARESILAAATKCVNGDRDHKYGNPENNFQAISELWSIYLGTHVSSIDVAMMMALLKIARAKANPKGLDSYIDLAGYAACAGEIAGTSETEKR